MLAPFFIFAVESNTRLNPAQTLCFHIKYDSNAKKYNLHVEVMFLTQKRQPQNNDCLIFYFISVGAALPSVNHGGSEWHECELCYFEALLAKWDPDYGTAQQNSVHHCRRRKRNAAHYKPHKICES